MRVNLRNLLIYAIQITLDIRPTDLRIREEASCAQVVCPGPEGVDCGARVVVQEASAVWQSVGAVGQVGRDFVAGDVGVGEGAGGFRGERIAADGPAHGVVGDVSVAVLGDVLWPDAAAVGGEVVLFFGVSESLVVRRVLVVEK